MLKLLDIRRVHVELTTKCNARCPMCMRNYRGSDYNSGYPDAELSLSDIQHILTPVLPQLELINFNGNLGDFALARQGAEIVKWLVSQGIAVHINTNGSLRTSDWWRELAHPLVRIGFALDGLADTHALYRQDTDWHRVIDNAQAFIRAGGYAIWRFVPFAHNQHQQQQCRDLSRQLGFREFENIYDGRDRGPVFDRNGKFSHWIGPADESVPDIQPLIQGHITWYNKNSKFEKDQPNIQYNCIHKRNREIYLAADGSVYPCCYLGFYPKTMQHPGNQELRELVHENNALEYSLEHCIEWFERVEQSWQQPSIAQGRTYQCVSTCAKL